MSLQTCFIHNRLNQERWTNHIYKNKRGRVHTSFSLISIISSYIVIIAFHLHDWIVWIIIVVHVHWTKLESASTHFKIEDQAIWALGLINNNAYKSHFKNFIMVFSYRPPKEKKRNKTIYTGKLPTSKRRTRNLFGFSFSYYYYKHGK